MSDLDVETLEKICDSLGESFGIGHGNQVVLIGLIDFLLSILLVAIMNETSMVVISYKGFGYLFSFP